MSILFESFEETYYAEAGVYGNTWEAMTFTPVTGHKITSVQINCRRESSENPGTVTVSIKAVNGGDYPDGADLASGTFAGGSLPTSLAWKEITFTAFALVAGTKYAIVIRAPNTDINEPLLVAMKRQTNGDTMYATGSRCSSSNGGSAWTVYDGTGGYPDDDLLFREYGIGYYPTDAVARVSSIRHIFRPGFFRMQVGLGDLGFDVDIAESTVRKALDTAKEVEPGPGYPEILEVLGMTAEEFAKMGREIAARRRVSTDFSAYEEQIAYEEWFQKQVEELRRMQE